jgi:diadenosine tetraphosphate (Ap4A) HIT family hydrolase
LPRTDNVIHCGSMVECKTCELVERRDAGDAPPWDAIMRTPWWDVVHAYGTAIEGWTVLVVRRHITAVADLTDDEAAELGPLIKEVSRAIQAAVDCDKTYVVQFAEHLDHPHVHVHVIPRARDLPDDRRGPRIFSMLGVADHDCVPEARMNELAVELRHRLAMSFQA